VSQLSFSAPLLKCAIFTPSTTRSSRAIPEASEAAIAIGTVPTASAGTVSRTDGGVMSLATTTVRLEEMTRPSRRIACACTACLPFFDVPAVFQVTLHRRALHDFAFTSSIRISTRRMSSPRAEPTISTVPAARDGTSTEIDVADCADDGNTRSAPIKAAETPKYVLHKAVSSQSGGPRACLRKALPSAARLSSRTIA
jgi:hypothetical protein